MINIRKSNERGHADRGWLNSHFTFSFADYQDPACMGFHVRWPNEIQMMSAGSGGVHSEFNASETEPVHVIQIWISPAAEDLEPSYQQVAFAPEEKRGRLRLLAAPELSEKPMTVIRQDARVY